MIIACGSEIDQETYNKYIDLKKDYSTVLPTCAAKYRLKNNTKRFQTKRKRKINQKWKNQQRVELKLKNKKLREEAVKDNQIEEEEVQPLDEN